MTSDYNWEKVFWVKPSDLNLIISSAEGFMPDFSNWGNVRDGDWDLNSISFESFPTLESLRLMFFENKLFEQTKLYSAMIDNAVHKNLYSIDEVRRKGEYIKNTFQRIKDKGFLTQEQLLASGVSICNPDGKFHDFITGAINRHGQIIIVTGFHRLAIAKLLCLDSIPIKIRTRHSLWDDFVVNTYKLCEQWWGKKTTYQSIPHIDFEDFNTIWSDCRFKIIKENSSFKQGTVLDLGSLFGFFSHKFEEDGFNVTAVEYMKEYSTVLDVLKKAKNKNFNVCHDSFLNSPRFAVPYKTNILLCLNVLHHSIKTEQGYKDLKRFFSNLEVDEVFFQTPECTENQMKGVFMNPTPRRFAEIIRDECKLKDIVSIYRENNRPLFKLSK